MDTISTLGVAQRFFGFLRDLEQEQLRTGIVHMERPLLVWFIDKATIVPAQLMWNFAVFAYDQLPSHTRAKMPDDLLQVMREGSERMGGRTPTDTHPRVVTWLHLSDLHCKGRESKDDYDRRTVIEGLWTDIESRADRIDQGLRQLDFVCLTGDLAFHGVKEEYDYIERQELPGLRTACGLDKDRLFIVPGNHDTCREKVTDAAKAGRKQLLEDPKSSAPITKALQSAEERAVYFQRLDAYREFFRRNFPSVLLHEEGWFYVQPIRLSSGPIVAILGLNSAWLSYGGKEEDLGKLAFGEYQVYEATSQAAEEGADLVIALNHHPFNWLAPCHDSKQARMLLQRHCHLVLQGHRHRNEAFQRDALIYILAGACYEDRWDPTLNSCNYVRLNLDNGEGQVFFRRFSNESRCWVPDVDVPGTDYGVKSFILDR
jgi:predicted phosphodiesterase